MKIFYEPINLLQWNMFEKIKFPGHIEPFLATKAMAVGDLLLLHVGQQDKRYQSGIYAIGEIIEGPFVLTGRPNDYCNNKLSVNVKITKINYSIPFILHSECTNFIRQFRTVHMIDSVYYEQILHCIK